MSKVCKKCETKPKARGLCRTHYDKFLMEKRDNCVIDGCATKQLYLDTGLCLKHHQQTPKGQSQKLMAKFGISIEQFDEMLFAQSNVCAICKQKEKRSQRLSVDHDHKTGQVRGLLCFACNAALGFFQDSTEILENAKIYLNKKGN